VSAAPVSSAPQSVAAPSVAPAPTPVSAPLTGQSPASSPPPAVPGGNEGKYVVWSSSPTNEVPRSGPEDI
jgi:hypothetical protein